MRVVVKDIVVVASDIISRWPDNHENALVRRLARAAGNLIHHRIDLTGLEEGEAYWLTKDGKKTDEALSTYLERRTERRKLG